MAECRASVFARGLYGRCWQRDANNTAGRRFFGSVLSVRLTAMGFLVA